VLRPEPDVRVGGQVQDNVNPAHRLRQVVEIEGVALGQGEMRGPLGLGQELGLPAREVIVAHHFVTVPQQPINQVTADKTGTAR
jgi:hypothetical protein